MRFFGGECYTVGKTDDSGREWFVVDNATMEDYLDDEMKRMVIWGNQIDEYTYLTLQEAQAFDFLSEIKERDGDGLKNIYYVVEVCIEYTVKNRVSK